MALTRFGMAGLAATVVMGGALCAVSVAGCAPAADGSAEDVDVAAEAIATKGGPVSFLVSSDLHFGHDESGKSSPEEVDDDHVDDDASEASSLTVTEKNLIAIEAMQLARSEASRQAFARVNIANDFRGLVVTGDVTDNGQQSEWDAFTQTYVDSNRKLLPVYETAGNHDYPIRPEASLYTRPSQVLTLSAIAERNKTRPNIVASAASGAYAWRWGNVLLVNLGVKPSNRNESLLEAKNGAGYRNTAPFDSLAFLARTLKNKTLVTPSTRVVLSFHYPMVTGKDRMNDVERQAFYDVIKDAPIAAIVHGHRHRSDVYAWCGIPVLEADTPRSLGQSVDASFLAVELSDHYLTARTVGFRRDRGKTTEIAVDPAGCRVKNGNPSRCWAHRQKLTAIRVTKGCDVNTTTPLAGDR